MVKYVITGRPGVGKSTLFSNIVDYLKRNNINVGGLKTPEVRDVNGIRIGFKIVDLITGDEAWLARVDHHSNIRVGKYGVLVSEAGRLIEKSLKTAIEKADVIGIDEVGPMELKIPVFNVLLKHILELDKPLILVVHYRLSDPYILSRLASANRIEVTIENRERLNRELPFKVYGDIVKFLQNRV